MLRPTLVTALILGLAVSLASPVAAQVQTDDRTQINVQGFGLVGGDFSFVSATFGLTRFVSQAIELGGDVQGSFGDFESYFLQGRLRLNLVTQSLFVPFISGSAGVQIFEVEDFVTGDTSTESSFAATAGGGFRRFINENVSFNGEALATITENAEGDLEVSDNVLLTFGISVFF